MKKFITMAMAAAMAASMGTTAMAADTKTATASNAGVLVDGEAIAPEAYTIDGYTFFKLRDVAAAVAGTEAGFDVAGDADAKKIALTTGVSYEAAVEAGKKAEGSKTATLSTAPVLVDGEETVLTAYTIDGYTYFKLRDLGEATGFGVTWDAEAKMIGINTAFLEEIELTEEEKAAKLEEAMAELEQVVEETEGLEETLEEMFPAEDEAADAEADTFDYELAADEPLEWEGETFVKDVILACAPVEDEESLYTAIFTDCVFEGDVFLVADGQAEVVIGEGCTFAEGKGVVVLEYTEGAAQQNVDNLSSVLVQAEGVNVIAETAAVVRTDMAGSSYTMNGVEYSKEDFGAEQVMYHQTTFCYDENAGGYMATHEAVVVGEDGNPEMLTCEHAE